MAEDESPFEVTFLWPVTVSVRATAADKAESMALTIKPTGWFHDPCVEGISTGFVEQVKVVDKTVEAVSEGKPV